MSDQTSDHIQPETRKPLATGRIALIAALSAPSSSCA
jgi:hypothetical protein